MDNQHSHLASSTLITPEYTKNMYVALPVGMTQSYSQIVMSDNKSEQTELIGILTRKVTGTVTIKLIGFGSYVFHRILL